MDERQPERPLRIALYSHDTMGLGHTRRNMLIARQLAARPTGAQVLLVSGMREIGAFPMAPSIDCLSLPGYRKTSEGAYGSRALELPVEQLTDLRARTIRSALTAFEPDLFIVDNVPRGARRELDSTLERLRKNRRTRIVLGLRDILDDPDTIRRQWMRQRNWDAVHELYDAVWVYGDRAFYNLDKEYGLGAPIAAKVRYAGYLGQRPLKADPAKRPFVLCAVGGGQDGAALATAFARSDAPSGMDSVLLTGPFMPEVTRRTLDGIAADRPNLKILDFTPEPLRHLAGAERVIAMGGYNTVTEILSYAKHALIVPRTTPRREQLIRAERLAAIDLVDTTGTEPVCPSVLSEWLAKPARRSDPAAAIDLGGLSRLSAFAGDLLEGPTALASPSWPDSPSGDRHVVH